MNRSTFLAYYVTRRIAADMDARGEKPPVLAQICAGLAGLAALGAVGCIVLFVVLATLSSYGVPF